MLNMKDSLKIIHSVHFTDFKNYTTQQIRDNFLVEQIEKKDTIELVYTHYDRMIAGLAKPVSKTLSLSTYENLKSAYFLERRELGVMNVGGDGVVTVDKKKYNINNRDCIYIGKGVKQVSFASRNAKKPALFYLLSAPAHQSFPTTVMTFEQATHLNLGSAATANVRTLSKYIHNDGIQSCQLVMGITQIKDGSVWNSVPPHTHDRRSEIYFYFDLAPENMIFHFMGEPQETRHMLVKNNEAIVSPSWSVHFGCGTGSYSFIWGMAGENKEFTDMDPAPVPSLK
jgi:4-deoxy-L-threo-5-hexosulose-uronate ketol-isomerase